jgi:hypothetical protein
MSIMVIRSYSDLRALNTFEDRYEYLRVGGQVGRTIFGFERYLNQNFYRSREWRSTRSVVLARDAGCDLGIPGFEIHDKPIIHHMNPMSIEDIESGNPDILNPEYLITTSHHTHNIIHYGDASQLRQPLVERRPGDTLLWSSSRRRRDA